METPEIGSRYTGTVKSVRDFGAAGDGTADDTAAIQRAADAGGTERFRHEGYFPKEAILAKWRELGVDLASAP